MRTIVHGASAQALQLSRVMRSFVLVLSAISLFACVKEDERRATTTLTSATVRPSHAVDNAGYVDNGGRSMDESTASTELGGARPTENGGRAPAETPLGVPIPQAGAPGNPRPDTAFDDRSQRISRAICDRETFCNRVGTGKTFGSQEECTVQFNKTAKGYIEAASCERGVDDAQLGSCLAAVRQLQCAGEHQTLQGIPACRAICNP